MWLEKNVVMTIEARYGKFTILICNLIKLNVKDIKVHVCN